MKKVFLFAAAIALTLASCGNKAQNAESQADSTTVAVDSATEDVVLSEETQATVEKLTAELTKAIEAKDGKTISATLTSLQETYKQLVEAGKLDEAKSYGAAIQKLVNEKADEIKSAAAGDVSAISSLVESVKNLPTSAESTAEDVKSAAENVANAAVNEAKTAAENKVKEVDEAAKKAVDDAKTKATDKVNEAKQKAKDKTNEAVDKAASKALKGLGL